MSSYAPGVTGRNSDLLWALHDFSSVERQGRYNLYFNYYMGNHALAFATEKFRSTFGYVFKEFAENMCGPVVDSLADRLVVTGFKTSEAQTKTEPVDSNVPTPQPRIAGVPPTPNAPGRKKVTTVDPLGEQALEIWRRNNMDERSNEVHTESLMMGDSYAIVWPNDNMEAEIWPQYANEVCVQYDPNNQKKILRAAKVWWDDFEGRWYLNIYTEVAIQKYLQKGTSRTFNPREESWTQYETVPNPYEVVPVFHFPNRGRKKHGISELKDVVPLQNAQNKSVMDMIIAMEFASFKQRWVIGLEIEYDEATGEPVEQSAKNYGVDRLLSFSDPEVKVGQFDATDLAQFLKVQDKFWSSVARVSGTPLHYFFITQGDFPSGEAMKSAEARFVKKITDRQTSYGNVWQDVMLFCMLIDGPAPKEDLRIETLWKDATPRSDSEIADTAVKKKAVGVSRSQILKELGYDDETIMRMLEESDADAERQALTKGGPPEPPNAQAQNPNGQPRPQSSGTQGVRRQ